MLPNLTLADARDLDHADLVERTEAILAAYDRPEVETHSQKLERVDRTLDEMPAIYRWFLQLESWAGHWSDASAEMWGIKDERYKALRQRRDLFEHMASAAKMRYEATSRLITLETSYDPTGMPRQRRGDG